MDAGAIPTSLEVSVLLNQPVAVAARADGTDLAAVPDAAESATFRLTVEGYVQDATGAPDAVPHPASSSLWVPR